MKINREYIGQNNTSRIEILQKFEKMRPCETGKLSLSEKRNRRQITNEICMKMIDGEKLN